MTAAPRQPISDKFKRQLTASQLKAVCYLEGPLLVIAGPGSGKTRVITFRIAALIDSGVRPHNICAITFTNKAAEEMRQRAASLGAAAGAYISTFHSLCVRILRWYAEKANLNNNFSIYDSADQTRCIKQAIKTCNIDTSNFPPSRMLDAISALKNRLIDVPSFTAEADEFFTKTLAKVYARYQDILTENNALDFDDLLMKAAFLLEQNDEVASELSNRFRYLLIDEYQDTNHAQYRISKQLASRHNNICATGDPDQSIYRWRGADIGNILSFEKDWPDAAVVKLEENFRSTPNILQAADSLIAFNQDRKQKKLVPTRPAGRDINIDTFEDERHEAAGVVQNISDLIDKGVSANDIAIFYRVNSASRILEEAFLENKIAYQIVRGVEFYRRKEIRDILAYMKIIANPSDEIALLRIINTPARGIGKTTIGKLRNYAYSQNITFLEALSHAGGLDNLSKAPKAKLAVFLGMINHFKNSSAAGAGQLAEQIFIESGLKDSLTALGTEGQNAVDNVTELINSAYAYDRQTEEPTLLDYLQQISLFTDSDAYDASKGAVALMTLHAAKGLEFDNVFIVGLEDGLLPHERSYESRQETEEERRLFFVGITRAESNLNISYARYRTTRGQLQRTVPSQFLFELGLDFAEPARESSYTSDDTDIDIDDIGETSEYSKQPFTAGQLVRHKVFGLGRVKQFMDMGPNSVVVIKFNTGHTKTLMVKYAELSILK